MLFVARRRTLGLLKTGNYEARLSLSLLSLPPRYCLLLSVSPLTTPGLVCPSSSLSQLGAHDGAHNTQSREGGAEFASFGGLSKALGGLFNSPTLSDVVIGTNLQRLITHFPLTFCPFF